MYEWLILGKVLVHLLMIMLFPNHDFFFPYNTKSDALTNAQAGLFHATETYSDQGLSKNDEN